MLTLSILQSYQESHIMILIIGSGLFLLQRKAWRSYFGQFQDGGHNRMGGNGHR